MIACVQRCGTLEQLETALSWSFTWNMEQGGNEEQKIARVPYAVDARTTFRTAPADKKTSPTNIDIITVDQNWFAADARSFANEQKYINDGHSELRA